MPVSKCETVANLNYPSYAIVSMTGRHIVVGGGGGAAKTGIMNQFVSCMRVAFFFSLHIFKKELNVTVVSISWSPRAARGLDGKFRRKGCLPHNWSIIYKYVNIEGTSVWSIPAISELQLSTSLWIKSTVTVMHTYARLMSYCLSFSCHPNISGLCH